MRRTLFAFAVLIETMLTPTVDAEIKVAVTPVAAPSCDVHLGGVFKDGVHFGQSDLRTKVLDGHIYIIHRDTEQLLRAFNLGQPIDRVELVEYPMPVDWPAPSRTMAVVHVGALLYAVNVESQPPRMMNWLQASTRIVKFEIFDAAEGSDRSGSAGPTFPALRVFERNVPGFTKFLMTVNGFEVVR